MPDLKRAGMVIGASPAREGEMHLMSVTRLPLMSLRIVTVLSIW